MWIREKKLRNFGVLFYVLLCFIGDSFSVTIQVRQKQYLCAQISVRSRCILRDRRLRNFEHRWWGSESVLKKVCDTHTSTNPFVVVVPNMGLLSLFIFDYCKFVVILFMCNIECINSSISMVTWSGDQSEKWWRCFELTNIYASIRW